MSLVKLLGCPCYVLSVTEIGEKILSAIQRGENGYSVAINAEKIMRYDSDRDLKSVIDSAWLPYIDGSGAVLGARWLEGLRGVKINMPILLLELANRHGLKVCVLGGEEHSHNLGIGVIGERYPNLKLVGHSHGYCDPADLQETVRTATPQITMVSMGSPRQELFASQLVSSGLGGMVFGCGGALDILAGVKRRAPAFFVDNHLEWLYRLWKEPARLGRQMVLPKYFIRLLVTVGRKKLGLSRSAG